jgi:DNA replication protein DnaC
MEEQILKTKLNRLKLTGLSDILKDRLKQATKEKWSYSHFLEVLFQDEIDRRNHSVLSKRLSKSGLDGTKSLETFDFSFNTKIHETMVRELATCSFIKNNENILIVGPSGVGKSHLGQALGHEAIRKGIDVLFYRTQRLLQWIQTGRCDGTRGKKMSQIIKVPLLIVDDFGLQDLNEFQQDDLYEIICERYEKNSTIITSNRDFGEWISIFKSPLMGSAALDRLIHRATSISIDGKSYRADQFIKKKKNNLKEEKK